MYTAVVLNEESCRNLVAQLEAMWNPPGSYFARGFLYETPSGTPLPHHMTLNMGGVKDGLNVVPVGAKVRLTVDAFCWNSSVCAARVMKAVTTQGNIDLKSTNAQPHVTMCLMPGAKPYESNDLDWEQAVLLSAPLVLKGVIGEC